MTIGIFETATADRHRRPETIELQRTTNKVDVPKVEGIQGWVHATELAILDAFRGEGSAGVFHHDGDMYMKGG